MLGGDDDLEELGESSEMVSCYGSDSVTLCAQCDDFRDKVGAFERGFSAIQPPSRNDSLTEGQ